MVSLVFNSPSQKSHDILLSLSYLVKDHMILLLLTKNMRKGMTDEIYLSEMYTRICLQIHNLYKYDMSI